MSKTVSPQTLFSIKFDPVQTKFTENESILYSLSIGFNTDPLKISDFKYTYERDDNFTTFPTFSTCMNKFDLFKALETLQSYLPDTFDPFRILHGTQKTEMLHPKLKPNTRYISYPSITDIQDKGKMSLLVLQLKTFEKLSNGKQDLACMNTLGIMLMGVGGFGYAGNGSTQNIPKQPSRKPDIILNDKSFPNQALFYRLNGDYNPLHIDPSASAMLGFKTPILHGLASYGIIAKCLVQNLLDDDPTRMKSYHCRFAGHVFPGESYQIRVWKQNRNLYFSVNVVQRGKPALIGVMETREAPKL